MIRCLPQSWMQCDLVELLVQKGFAGLFNLVYLPMNFRNGKNFSYAFLNMVDNASASKLFETLHGLDVGSSVIECLWSSCQGFEANVERYRNNPVMHDTVPLELKPAVYDRKGHQVTFPSPTKHIPKPRIHWTPKDDVSNNEVCSSFRNQMTSKLPAAVC